MKFRVALFVMLLALLLFVGGALALRPTPNPCSAIVHVRARDSLYAELQAPATTTVCEHVVIHG